MKRVVQPGQNIQPFKEWAGRPALCWSASLPQPCEVGVASAVSGLVDNVIYTLHVPGRRTHSQSRPQRVVVGRER